MGRENSHDRFDPYFCHHRFTIHAEQPRLTYDTHPDRPARGRNDTTMKVFQMNQFDWWMAPTLEEARVHYQRTTEYDPEDFKSARELTDEEMDRLIFHEEKWVPDHPDAPLPRKGQFVTEKRSFREELERRMKRGPKTECFATTEE